jgi:hypothetical protein
MFIGYVVEFLSVVAPALMLVGSVMLWQKTGGIPAILQIIGSVALLLWGVYSFVFILVGVTGFIDLHNFLWVSKWSWLRHGAMFCMWIAGFFFPVGFVWHALRASRRI